MDKLVGIPTLDELAKNPALSMSLPPEKAKALWLDVLTLEKALAMRAMMPGDTQHEADKLLTVPEVAELLKVSEYRAYELVRQGHIAKIKMGKSVRVRRADLDAYVAKQGA
jgi:excisionase family DNA binding protein